VPAGLLPIFARASPARSGVESSRWQIVCDQGSQVKS
jgi:hypothetical protein